MDAARCDHETRINSTAHDAPKWIPCSFIEPIQKLIETTLNHVGGGTVIEPRCYQYHDDDDEEEEETVVKYLFVDLRAHVSSIGINHNWKLVERREIQLTMDRIREWYFQTEWQQINVMQNRISMRA